MTQGHKKKFVRHRLLFLLALTACFVIATVMRAHASAEDHMDQAIAASKAWVAQIDAGKYEDSYSFACNETRDKFPQTTWVNVLKDIRKQWGDVVDRHQMSHVYKSNGVPGLAGECVVVTYSTNFKNLANATETVTLKWQDGEWRGAGYFAGPTPDPNAQPLAPAYTTETHTDEHVQATPQ